MLYKLSSINKNKNSQKSHNLIKITTTRVQKMLALTSIIICLIASQASASLFNLCTNPPPLETFDEAKVNHFCALHSY